LPLALMAFSFSFLENIPPLKVHWPTKPTLILSLEV
jgi:hypothetical protein